MATPLERWALGLLLVFSFFSSNPLRAQDSGESMDRRHHVGSSAFVSFTFLLDRSPDFYQFNYGYRLTERDVLSAEAITWKYWAPLGIPHGTSETIENEYPGEVREFGVGAAYQRFFWKDAYVAVHALPLVQQYQDEGGERIQNGFQLFLTYRLGYHISLFGGRFFLEPSVAVTHWPINTNAPAAFAAQDSRWPNYLLFEPGLHFGIRF